MWVACYLVIYQKSEVVWGWLIRLFKNHVFCLLCCCALFVCVYFRFVLFDSLFVWLVGWLLTAY